MLAIDEASKVNKCRIQIMLCFGFDDLRDGLGQVSHRKTDDISAGMDA